MSDFGDELQNRDDYGEDRGQWFEEARRRVQTPGTILFVFGLISVFIAVAALAIDFIAPDVRYKPMYDLIVDLQKKGQAPGQPQGQALPPYEEWVQQQKIQNIVAGVFSLACSVLIVIGASKMKSLQSYGWAMTSAIMGMIPCTNNCCCLSIPFGIWALVVLLNGDVKLAFARVKAGPEAES